MEIWCATEAKRGSTEGLYEIIALDGSDIPEEFDLSQAVIIDGDVRVTGSLTMGGNIVCNKYVEV